jgi:hypothetical protein
MEYTRFPVPTEMKARPRPSIRRCCASDLNYMRKISALFTEFEETGMNKKLGYNSSADLRAACPKFFWSTVTPTLARR